MAETKIQWTGTPRADGTIAPGYTFNPWMGCQKVSPGCANCYAEALMDLRFHKVEWGADGERKRTTPQNWKQPFKWHTAAYAAGERRKVFCASAADIFEDRPEVKPWREELWPIIEATPWLIWLLLTKRPENVLRMYPTKWLTAPRHNVWLGTSVENQQACNKRLLPLLKLPAAVRFLSCEPLLGPVNIGLAGTLPKSDFRLYQATYQRLHWVIAGGESGLPKYDKQGKQIAPRRCKVEWLESIRDECAEVDTPFFLKQLGTRPLIRDAENRDNYVELKMHDKNGGKPTEWPEPLRVRQWPVDVHA